MLQRDHKVTLRSKRSALIDHLYLPMYQMFPGLWNIPFKVSQAEIAQPIIFDYLRNHFDQEIRQLLRSTKPDLIINTHFLYQPILQQLIKESKNKVLNVITDPIVFHPLTIFEEARANFLYSEETLKIAQEMNQNAKYAQTGWWVREQFAPVADKPAQRVKLGLKPNVVTLVLASGSDGTQGIMKIFPLLMKKGLQAQVVVACGSNKNMQRASFLLANFLEKQGSGVSIHVLGFTKEMHKYFAVADLVVGKAGPNTLFEAIACHVPFMAITHIEGQETANLDLIRDENIGWVEEKAAKANILLEKLITDKHLRESKQKDIERLAAYNAAAPAKVRAVVDRVLKEKNE